MTTQNNDPLKEEILRWIFSILGAVLVFFFVAQITVAVYHPDIDELTAIARKLLAEPSYSRPEPVEALLFRLGVITVIPSLLCFYWLLSRSKLVGILSKEPYFLSLSVLTLVAIIALIYVDFAALNPYGAGNGDTPQNSRDGVSSTNFDFYFDGLFVGNYLLAYAFVIVPLVSALFLFGFRKKNWDTLKSFNIASSAIGYLVIGFTIVAIVIMNTFYFPYANDNKFNFSAVYYSMTQVYAGLPMLVDHFTNTYGLYPQFLNPIFQLTGLSIFTFSLVMSLLLGLSFVFNFFFLKRLVSNKIILFLGFTTILFFPYLDFKFTNPFDCIFSAYPIRYLIPCTVTLLATVYFQKRSAIIYWITFFVSAYFILWNPEMGMVCFMAWIAANVYIDFFDKAGKPAYRRMLFHIATGISMAIVVFYTYKLIIWVSYGTAPDLRLLFSSIYVFGQLGFYMLPMSLIHPWNITALILIIGFIYSIVRWLKKEVTPKSAVILMVSVIALGYFLYFQGRSQNTNFALSSGFCLALLTLLGDELWKTVKTTKVLLLNALFVVFLLLVSFSVLEIVFGYNKALAMMYQEDDKKAQAAEQETDEKNIDFIVKHSKPKEKILVIVQKKSEALFFAGNKRKSAFNPGFIDLPYLADAARLENLIADSSFQIFTQPTDHTYAYMSRPFAALAATYEFNAVNGNLVLLHKRNYSVPRKTFFNDTDRVVVHRKYTDDSEGIRRRINDALGFPVATPFTQQFSVQLLFYSVPQMLPDATLIANTMDSSGFTIANVHNTPNYYFSVNATKVPVPIPGYQWVYTVMNVYPDHYELYTNGDLYFTASLSRPASTVATKISIGNKGTAIDYHHFISAISEVAVINKTLDSNQIRKRWSEIKEAVKQ